MTEREAVKLAQAAIEGLVAKVEELEVSNTDLTERVLYAERERDEYRAALLSEGCHDIFCAEAKNYCHSCPVSEAK